jgi:tetratricopeptide (TPR) repeat protein
MSMKRFPNVPELHLSKATVLYHLEEVEEAIRTLELALQIKPNYLSAHLNMASML